MNVKPISMAITARGETPSFMRFLWRSPRLDLKWQRSPLLTAGGHRATSQARGHHRGRQMLWEGERGHDLRRSILSQVIHPVSPLPRCNLSRW